MAAPVPPAWVVRGRLFFFEMREMPPLSALAVPAVLPRNCPVEIPGSRTEAREKRLQPFKPQYTLDESRRMRSIADNTGADDANLET